MHPVSNAFIAFIQDGHKTTAHGTFMNKHNAFKHITSLHESESQNSHSSVFSIVIHMIVLKKRIHI